MHSPEFAFEHERDNVEDAVRRHGIRYPVALDNDFRTWLAWDNRYWPSTYLIDRGGRLRRVHLGEDRYGDTEHAIRTLLGEPAAPAVPPPGVVVPAPDSLTPETYLGSARDEARQERVDGRWHRYEHQHRLFAEVTLDGLWRVQPEYAEAGGDASLRLRFVAPRVYVVLAPPASGPVRVQVILDDGAPTTVEVTRNDVYAVVDEPGRAQDRELELRLPPGTRAYAFTFG